MKKLNKVICLSLSAMMLAAAISGCGAKETTDTKDTVQSEATGAEAPAGEMSRDNTMIYGAEFMVEKFNPILGSEYCDAMIFRGLMKTDVDCQPQCDIATDYEISDDLLTYTFNIRDDVKFHDGTTLTADDVVFTISSILDENVNSSIRSDFLLVDKVEKLSDTSLSITLKEPFPALLDKLTVGIVPEHCFEGQDINTADFNVNPVGCGPYKLVSLEAGTKCTMTRFDDYYGDKAQIENIIYLYLPDYNTRALQLKNNEIDFTFVEPSQIKELESDENLDVYVIGSADYRCVMYNFQVCDLFEDVRVRQALNYATNKESIVNDLLDGYGNPATGLMSPTVPYVTEENSKGYPYDPDKAKELLKEAGYEDTDGDGIVEKDGEPLSLRLVFQTEEYASWKSLCEFLKSEYEKVGVGIELVEKESAAYYDEIWNTRDYDLCIYRSYEDSWMPHGFLKSMFYAEDGAKAVNWYDEELNKDLGEVLKTQDEEKRTELYDKILTRINDQAVTVPLYYPNRDYIYNNTRLTNVELAPTAYEGINWATLDVVE